MSFFGWFGGGVFMEGWTLLAFIVITVPDYNHLPFWLTPYDVYSQKTIIITMGNCFKILLNWLHSFSAAHTISGKKLREVKHIA